MGASDGIIGLLKWNRAFTKALTRASIPHIYEEYDGDHHNRIKARLQTKVLLFFSKVLAFEMCLQ